MEEDVDAARLAERLEAVRAKVRDAEQRAGRPPGSVKLLAVSKTQPAGAIRAAYRAGQRDFGENYVQELVGKAEALADLEGLVWHAIGTLQRNKVKSIARVVKLVHAIDREELAVEIGKRASQGGVVIEGLVEVNVGGEASKGGCEPEALGALLDRIGSLDGLRVRGLMTIPPADDDAERVRPFFAKLRQLRDANGGERALPELSMGMSHDFAIAIEEGATLVRVGTAIFGARVKAT